MDFHSGVTYQMVLVAHLRDSVVNLKMMILSLEMAGAQILSRIRIPAPPNAMAYPTLAALLIMVVVGLVVPMDSQIRETPHVNLINSH